MIHIDPHSFTDPQVVISAALKSIKQVLFIPFYQINVGVGRRMSKGNTLY